MLFIACDSHSSHATCHSSYMTRHKKLRQVATRHDIMRQLATGHDRSTLQSTKVEFTFHTVSTGSVESPLKYATRQRSPSSFLLTSIMFHILGRNRSSRSPSRSPESTRFFTQFRGGASRPTGSSTVGRSESSEPAVPYKMVRLLLLGELSPIDLALRVKRINTCGFRPKVQLSDIKINTVEDVLFVGLCYAGFDQDRQRDLVHFTRLVLKLSLT
jgi:hypothetical protein